MDMELNKKINALWAQLPSELDLDEKFYARIMTGKTDKLRVIVEQYPLLKEIAKTDQSILLGPVYNYQPAMIQYLVNKLGLDTEFRRREGAFERTLLLEVLHQHHTSHRNVNLSPEKKFDLKCATIKMLLDLHANIQATDCFGNAALHYAITNIQHIDVVTTNNAERIIKILLKNQADPNQQNNVGKTSLHTLLCLNQFSLDLIEPLIKLLIDHGAREDIGDKIGLTPKIMILQRSLVASNP